MNEESVFISDEIYYDFNASDFNSSTPVVVATPHFFDAPVDPVWTPGVLFRVTALALLMFVTFVGNVLLILLITSYSNFGHRRVSVFLLNLSVGDLIVCVFTMTTEILFVAFGEWVLGEVACKVTVYGQIVTLASTTFLLTAMSIDRYQALVQPFSARKSSLICNKICISWLLAFIFATPQIFIFVQAEEIRDVDQKKVYVCKSAGYTSPWQRKVYFTFLTSYILIIPTAIMTYCYASIIYRVWAPAHALPQPRIHFVTTHRSTHTSDESSNNEKHQLETAKHTHVHAGRMHALNNHPGSLLSSQTLHNNKDALTASSQTISRLHRQALLSKRSVIKMTLCVIVAFVVCFTPYYVVSLVRIYSDYRYRLETALSMSEILCLLHSALNPILYMIYSRRAVRTVYKKIRDRCRCLDSRSFTTALEDA